MEADLQAGNLVQIKTEYSQPVREAKSGVLAQRYDLTNMGRDAVSQLIEETGGNEIRRSASVAPTSGSRKLSDGAAILAQNIPDALGSSAPATLPLSIFAAFDAAKRGPCASHPEHTTNRGRRVHSSIVARLLALSAKAGATSLGALLLPFKRLCEVRLPATRPGCVPWLSELPTLSTRQYSTQAMS
jgi:hypothetical protein